MADLTNPRWICTKGFLFLLCGLLSAAILIAEMPNWRMATLLCVSVWSFCRFYYFAFYVIQHYVDDQYRFAGLLDFGVWWITRQPPQPRDPPGSASSDDNML